MDREAFRRMLFLTDQMRGADLATSLVTSSTELDACSQAHWEFFRASGGRPGSRTTNFLIKLRACQGSDTMTVSRHHVVTQPLCDIRKSYLFVT